MTTKYHKQARKIISEQLGRKLSMLECVHHIDKNPSNNDISNLQLVTREDHSSIHGGFSKRRKYPAWNKTSSEIIERIIQLYQSGLNYSKIGRELHISNMTARKYSIKTKGEVMEMPPGTLRLVE